MESRIYFEKFLSHMDFEYFTTLVFNEEVMLMNYGRVFSLEEAEYIYEWILKTGKEYEKFGAFKVFQRSNNTFIGYGALMPSDGLTKLEIEYMLLPEYWGKGYGSEIVRELLKNIEEIKDIEKIIANVDPHNVRSKKILINSGFTSYEFFENSDDGSIVESFMKIIS